MDDAAAETPAEPTPAAPRDGRVARRERNIEAALDVAFDVIDDGSLFPTIEEVAKRSGLSERSLYRYFADPVELLEATIVRSRDRAYALTRLHKIGQGPFIDRVDSFISMRLSYYGLMGAIYQASVANAPQSSSIRRQLYESRDVYRQQIERHFAPELDRRTPAEREVTLSGVDVATRIESIEYLRGHRELSIADTAEVLRSSMLSLFGEPQAPDTSHGE